MSDWEEEQERELRQQVEDEDTDPEITPITEPETPETPKSLALALLAAQRAVKPLIKDSVNAFHNFRYVSAEKMFTACRELLLDQGLVVSRGNWEVIELRDFVAIRQEITIEYPETGEARHFLIDFPFQAEKGKPWDKSLASSLTVALSYWLRDLLLIPREEEGMNARDDRGYQPPAREERPPQDRPPERPQDRPREVPPASAPPRKSIFADRGPRR